MRRRDFVKTGAILGAVSSLMSRRMWADVPDHLWEGYDFGCPTVTNRLDQGPFGIAQVMKVGSRFSPRSLRAITSEISAPVWSATRGRKTVRP